MNDIYWIADASSNHMNSIEEAYKIIESAAKSGVSACKFQAFTADSLIDKKNFKKIGNLGHQEKWNESVYEIHKKYELDLNWIPKLSKCCIDNNIDFMCTPYYFEAVNIIDKYVDRHKIGSGDINFYALIEYIAKKKKPVYLGCGAAEEFEIRKAQEIALKHSPDVKLLLCNTNYSGNDFTNSHFLNLNCLDKMDGLSDHTKLFHPIIIALAKGKKIIERHFKRIDNDSPDNLFSMNPREWRQMIIESGYVQKMLGSGKIGIEKNEKLTRVIQRRDMKTLKRPDISYFYRERIDYADKTDYGK
jgi:sialic acid synthase SpsE